MTTRTYIELFEPQTRLRLIPVPGGYTVRDQNGQPYVLAPSSFAFCCRLMRAMQTKKDALIDEDSVLRWYRHEHWKAHKTGGGEPQSGAAARAEDTSSIGGSDLSRAGSSSPPVTDFSVAVPSNVHPIRKGA